MTYNFIVRIVLYDGDITDDGYGFSPCGLSNKNELLQCLIGKYIIY